MMDTLTKLVLMLLLFCSSCNGRGEKISGLDMQFDRLKWDAKKDHQYTFRKHMIHDLLKNYQWGGIKKDSVIIMLGQPDDIDGGNLMYSYDRRPVLGGLGTTIEAIVFELAPDSTVRIARLSDGGWD